jgi:acyl CoA:acetate/3-ketoacid CoA transferase
VSSLAHAINFVKTLKTYACRAAKVCIAEVEEIVDAGALDPEHVHLPSVFVHRIVKSERLTRFIEHRTVRSCEEELEDCLCGRNSCESRGTFRGY